MVESHPEIDTEEKETDMVDKNDVAAVLELIRPSLQADGGDVQLVDVTEDGVVKVELQGACILKERVPGVTSVVPADIM